MQTKSDEIVLLGERIKATLKRLNLKPADLAKGAGISRGQISELFAGKKMMGRQSVDKAAQFLKVPFGWLYYGADREREFSEVNSDGNTDDFGAITVDHGSYSSEEFPHVRTGQESLRNMIESLPPSATMRAIIGGVQPWLDREINPEAGSPLDISGLDAVQVCIDHLRKVLAQRSTKSVVSPAPPARVAAPTEPTA